MTVYETAHVVRQSGLLVTRCLSPRVRLFGSRTGPPLIKVRAGARVSREPLSRAWSGIAESCGHARSDQNEHFA